MTRVGNNKQADLWPLNKNKVVTQLEMISSSDISMQDAGPILPIRHENLAEVF